MNFRNFFYTNIENKIVHLQSALSNFPPSDYLKYILQNKYSLETKTLNINNEKDIIDWISVINDSYDDANYDYHKGRDILTNHLFLIDTETFLIQHTSNITVATISIGKYKDNCNVGGAFRLAVRKKFKNAGIGKVIITYAYAKLKERNIIYGESLIASKRTASIMAHFKLGFIPQYNMKYISYKKSQKNVNFIQKFRLRKRLRSLYKNYLQNLNEHFIQM